MDDRTPPDTAEPDQPTAQAEIDDLRRQLQDNQDRLLRALAETENVRRRSADDVSKAHRFGVEGFAGALLAVKDSLDAALTVENASIESFKQGVEITSRQLDSVFEKFAIKVLDPAGEKFDPHRHQAISQVPSDQPANPVVAVLQKGYLLHDRVLRPALVTVAAGPGS